MWFGRVNIQFTCIENQLEQLIKQRENSLRSNEQVLARDVSFLSLYDPSVTSASMS